MDGKLPFRLEPSVEPAGEESLDSSSAKLWMDCRLDSLDCALVTGGSEARSHVPPSSSDKDAVDAELSRGGKMRSLMVLLRHLVGAGMDSWELI